MRERTETILTWVGWAGLFMVLGYGLGVYTIISKSFTDHIHAIAREECSLRSTFSSNRSVSLWDEASPSR